MLKGDQHDIIISSMRGRSGTVDVEYPVVAGQNVKATLKFDWKR
jgi:hypothetical protein